MADSEGGSEQDDVSFLRTVSCIYIWIASFKVRVAKGYGHTHNQKRISNMLIPLFFTFA